MRIFQYVLLIYECSDTSGKDRSVVVSMAAARGTGFGYHCRQNLSRFNTTTLPPQGDGSQASCVPANTSLLAAALHSILVHVAERRPWMSRILNYFISVPLC